MSEAAGSRTVPDPSEISQPFWDATRETPRPAALRLVRVARLVPRGFCPGCLSEDLQWVEVSGLGTVYAVSVHHRARHPSSRTACPTRWRWSTSTRALA